MKPEHRKGYLFNIPPGQWVTICIIAMTWIWGAATYVGEVKANTEDIEKHEKKHEEDIRALRTEFHEEIKEMKTQIKDTNDKVYDIHKYIMERR